MYNLEFLPVARQDMIECVRYISRDLGNPKAAERLAKGLIGSTETISSFPYANPAYTPIRPLNHEYRRMLVRNYSIFYWVDEEKKQITVARVIYSKRDLTQLLD